jgi:hypothetical protein
MTDSSNYGAGAAVAPNGTKRHRIASSASRHEGDKPLARARRRLGGPGRPKTTEPSRFAQFRRRHPEYVARERKRLERRRKNSGQPLAQEQDAAAGSSEGAA